MPELSPSLPASAAAGPRNGRPRGIPVFFLALLIGVSAHLAVLLVFKLDLERAKPVAATHALVQYTALGKEDDFSDPAQIYLSGERNFSSQKIQRSGAEPPQVFNSLPVQVTPSESDFHLLVSAANAPKTPTAALQPAQWDFLQTMGQAANPGSAMPARGAVVHLSRQATLSRNTTVIPDIFWPENMAPAAGNTPWSPTHFTLLFDATGLVGQPFLQTTSGNDEVDKDLRAKLRDWYMHHPPLPPGHYEAVIGP